MKIQIFKPEIENFDTDKLSFKAALMVSENDENVFGSFWGDANVQTDRSNRTVRVTKVSVNDLRFPDGYAANKESGLIKTVEKNLTGLTIKMDDILADLENEQNEQKAGKLMDNTPPVIYYSSHPAILLTIDGDPVLQSTDTKDIEMIVNSPFLVLKYKNNYYLSNGQLWYESKSPLAGWAPQANVPETVRQTAQSLKSDEENVVSENSFYPEVIVSTTPAELIQTDGAPTFSVIPETMLLYVSNSSDQIVMDIKSQMYFVLLSGRWYSSAKLDGNWKYIDFNDLPADFAKIPEGSTKDILLASVPGTKAAQEAVRESLVPQAAIVDRSVAQTEVAYDGEPQFENIEGTNMKYAVNSSGTVIYENRRYYVVDNGVWFAGSSPRGPWIVSDVRPVQINIIPPSYPVYNARFVYIYHSTPTAVYVGYTRGYLSTYVTGRRVVVYGTGCRYRPWRGHCYYPRPCTWGYGVSYSPWSGWSVNYIYGSGWFGYSYPNAYRHYYPHYRYTEYRHPYRCGWWGPSVYRPAYCVPHTHYYGNQHAHVATSNRYNINTNNARFSGGRQSRNNNIYTYNDSRRGVSSSNSRVLSSTSHGRENLTRTYSYQARPSLSNSRNSSTSNSRNSSSRTSDSRSSVSSRNQGSSSLTNSSRNSTVSRTQNPAQSSQSGRSSSLTEQQSRSSSSTRQPSQSSSTEQRNRNNSTTTSRSNSTTTPTTSRSSSTTTPTTSRSNSTTTAPATSRSNSTTTPATSRSNSTTTPATSRSSSTTTAPASRSSSTTPATSRSSSTAPATSRSSSTVPASRSSSSTTRSNR
ncbi:MAG: hypothetical protein LBG92_01725 [Prevotellaceae bacterium]|nr:hypothetical protein [Prevotellaceae bacterium]